MYNNLKADRIGGIPLKHGKFEEQHNQEPVLGLPAEEKTASGKKMLLKDIMVYLHDWVFLLGIGFVVLLLCFKIVVVSGTSMKNTLLDGDYLVLISSSFYKDPQYGDIIVASKDSYENGAPIVKRVIATEGQTVDIDFEAGIVYVDGVALDEPYVSSHMTHLGIDFPLVVDAGCLFVMGDNRIISEDSRSPKIGQIDRREVLGKAIFLFVPGTDKGKAERDFSRLGVLSDGTR